MNLSRFLFRCLLIAAVFVPDLFIQAAERRAQINPGVEKGAYSGWLEALFLDAPEAQVRAVVVPVVGGRLLHYGRAGQNILYEQVGSEGKTLATAGAALWLGGHQADLGPELRGIPSHPELFVGAYTWESDDDYMVTVTSKPDPATGAKIEKEFTMDPQTGDLGLTQRLINSSDREIAYCLWDRTLCDGGGFAFFPLNKKSRFKAGWSLRRGAHPSYTYDGVAPSSPNVHILGDLLVAEARGPATKVGADSDAGWIAYVKGRLLFVKYFPVDPKGNYTDGGNTVELYFDPKVAELEPLSPEVRLKPGEQYDFPEKWTLTLLKKEVTSTEEVRALARRIPKSPFQGTQP